MIYGMDVGIDGLRTAWVKINRKGEVEKACKSVTGLIDSLYKDLKFNRLVALGFEAPMWIPIPKATNRRNEINFEMQPRFKSEGRKYGWYQGVAAQASIKTLVISKFLFDQNFKDYIAPKITKDKAKWINGEKQLYVFEGFAAGKFKPREYYPEKDNLQSSPFYVQLKLETNDQIDAFTIASAFWYEINNKKKNPLPVDFIEHLSFSVNSKDETDQEMICLWEMIFGMKIQGPKACDVYGFRFSD